MDAHFRLAHSSHRPISLADALGNILILGKTVGGVALRIDGGVAREHTGLIASTIDCMNGIVLALLGLAFGHEAFHHGLIGEAVFLG